MAMIKRRRNVDIYRSLPIMTIYRINYLNVYEENSTNWKVARVLGILSIHELQPQRHTDHVIEPTPRTI